MESLMIRKLIDLNMTERRKEVATVVQDSEEMGGEVRAEMRLGEWVCKMNKFCVSITSIMVFCKLLYNNTHCIIFRA